MRSDFIVITSIGSQDAAQMRLAQDDDMVHTLAPDRSDQPFGKAILPRRGRRRRLVPDAHRAHPSYDAGAIGSIPIANEVARSLIPRNASVSWRETHSAVGFVVTLIQTTSLRSSRTMTKA